MTLLKPIPSIAAFVVALSLGAPCEAQRSDDDLGRAHFQSGSAYYEQGRYEEAAREFVEAYELSRRPELLDNAARSYERALLFDEAIATLEQMRELQPERTQAISNRIEAIRELQTRVGGGEASAQSDSPEPPAAAAGGGSISVPGIVLLASGGALGIGALITALVGHSIFEDLSASCSPDRVCPAARQADIDTGGALVITSTVFTFAAPIAAAVGVILLVVDGGGGGEEQALRVVPGPGDAGLAMEGSF